MRPLLSLAVTGFLFLSQLPVSAEQETKELEIMDLDLNEVVKFSWGPRAQTQGAGTPNQAGVEIFAPLNISDNNVFFLDGQVNYEMADQQGSSIVNTAVAGGTVSTSTRLGYRWLSPGRLWMFGFNAGYDSRPLNPGDVVTNNHYKVPLKHNAMDNSKGSKTTLRIPHKVTDSRQAFFQQLAVGVEAINGDLSINSYALLPIGDVEQKINSRYNAGSLNTYGIDLAYDLTSKLRLITGYYYQHNDLESVNGSGIEAGLSYEVAQGLTGTIGYSYDEAYEARLLGRLTYRFGAIDKLNGNELPSQIKALSYPVQHRNVRVHDGSSDTITINKCFKYESDGTTLDFPSTETCAYYSTGYESSITSEETKDEAYDSCVKKLGSFSFTETIKLSTGKTKYKYYCKINT